MPVSCRHAKVQHRRHEGQETACAGPPELEAGAAKEDLETRIRGGTAATRRPRIPASSQPATWRDGERGKHAKTLISLCWDPPFGSLLILYYVMLLYSICMCSQAPHNGILCFYSLFCCIKTYEWGFRETYGMWVLFWFSCSCSPTSSD